MCLTMFILNFYSCGGIYFNLPCILKMHIFEIKKNNEFVVNVLYSIVLVVNAI